ncbi:MAG: ABC transporter permease, partial [Angelakisella sp.]
RLLPKRRKLVMLLVVVPFWTNALVRIYGWMIILRTSGVLNKFLLATGLVDVPLKILYTYGAVLIGMVYSLLPFMILPVYSSVEKMDWSLVEAARDLGASRLTAFLTVTLKLTLPGLLSGFVLVFVPSIGLFFISDLLGGGKIMLVGNLIKTQLLQARDWPFGAALSVVMMAMTITIIALYKKITKSDLEGLV